MAINWLPPGVRARGVEALRGPLEAGQVAFDAGRYMDAMRFWRKAAQREGGDGEAQFRIGRLYRSAKGVFMNFAEAAHWYDLASQRGHIQAKLELAKIYLSGASDFDASRFREVRRDPESPATATLAALIFPHGDKVKADAEKARALLDEVVAAGEVEGVDLLALLCLSGRGGERDLDRARQLLEMSAASGRASGHFGLGDLYFRGAGVEVDQKRAADHYEKAAEM